MANPTAEFRYRIPLEEMKRFVWIYFAVGIVGMALPWTREIFFRLVPVTFLVYAGMILLSDRTRNARVWWIAAIIFVAGWLVEVAGVNTGLLFGEYVYSRHLGPAVFGTPLIIGLSWAIMLYLTSAVVQEYTMHPFYRTVLTAVLMTILDFLLEPAAVWMQMWKWEGGHVPVQNYMMWFVVSLLLASLFPLLKVRIRNRLATRLLVAQMVFFLLVIALSWIHKRYLG